MPRLTRRRLLGVGAGFVGLSAAATAGYAGAIEPFGLRVTPYRLTPPGWPAGNKLTVTAIADLHAGGPNMLLPHVRQVVDTANSLHSDVIVLLGDFKAWYRFKTEAVADPDWAAELARLKAPLGTWAILGNHDWWHDIEGVRKALRDVRIPAMQNEAVLLGEKGNRFWLAGLGDQLAHWIGPSQFIGVDDLPGTLKQLTTDDPVILLAHEPDIFVRVPEHVSLTLAGHTHGGQIKLPLIPPIWAPTEYLRFAYGHIVERGRHMIVSGGLGCSKVPMRLGVPPEILRIDLGSA